MAELLAAYEHDDDHALTVAAASSTHGVVLCDHGWAMQDHLRSKLPEAEVMAAIAEAVDQPASAQTGSVVLSGLSVYLGPEGRQTVDDKMSQLRALGETPVVVVLADRCDQLTALSSVGRAGRSRWSPPSGLAPFLQSAFTR